MHLDRVTSDVDASGFETSGFDLLHSKANLTCPLDGKDKKLETRSSRQEARDKKLETRSTMYHTSTRTYPEPFQPHQVCRTVTVNMAAAKIGLTDDKATIKGEWEAKSWK